MVAVVALPDNAAVIVPAEKFPEASRATTLEAVLASVASTANVLAVAPVYVPPEVIYEPAVKAAKVPPNVTPDIVFAANLETAIAAAALISASTITPDPIDATPADVILISPLT